MISLPLYLENEARVLILARTLFSLAVRGGSHFFKNKFLKSWFVYIVKMKKKVESRDLKV